jgi:hypothetical protein
MTKILGFDSFILSTAERPTISDLPVGGLFMAATPEFLCELEKKRQLVEHIERNFANFIEPECDSVH